MSALPKFSMHELLDAGVHFGHKTMRWNPRMKPYIFGIRNDVHIIDLQQTVPMLYRALKVVHEVVSKNGRILFVGTKRQASKIISEQAKRCGQYYVDHRWLGGMLTNWNTISASIKTLQDLEAKLIDTENKYSKKEKLKIDRERQKLELSLGGIRAMGGLPDLLFIVDTNKEKIAVDEANRLRIPVIAIVDSNSNPDNITHPIPGNDDAIRAIELYCRLIADTALQGIEASLAKHGADIGALEAGMKEKLPANDDANRNRANRKKNNKPAAAKAAPKVAAAESSEPAKEAEAKEAPAAKEEKKGAKKKKAS